MQGDALNRSNLATVVCVPLTSNLNWADASGNVLLSAQTTGLPRDSVALVAQVVAHDKSLLTKRCGKVPPEQVELIFAGLGIVLGR